MSVAPITYPDPLGTLHESNSGRQTVSAKDVIGDSYYLTTYAPADSHQVIIGGPIGEGDIDVAVLDRSRVQSLVLALQAWLDTGRLEASPDYRDLRAATEAFVQERLRQEKEEGFDLAHDDAHSVGELGDAAAVYAMDPDTREFLFANKMSITDYVWLWEEKWLKLTPADREKELTKAGALLLSETTRRLRMKRAVAPSA